MAVAAGPPAAPKSYDPVKALDGMFWGAIIRIAQALKDPKFRSKTRLVVAECTKKYHDTLDDCEVQILDAKWYLESKLAENKARREAEARAKEANRARESAKRKHNELEEPKEQLRPGTPAKRARSHEPPSPRTAVAAPDLSSAQPVAASGAKVSQQDVKEQTPSKAPSQPPEQEKTTVEAKSEAQPDTNQEPQPSTDDFVRTSGQGTPALSNDEFVNFESMFGEPTDTNDVNENEDMEMDFNFEDAFAGSTANPTAPPPPSASATQSQSQPQTQSQSQSHTQTQPSNTSNTTNTLVSGMEQVAPQPEDTNALTFNGGQQTQNTTQQNTPNIFTDEFGPNIFDSMLNDENFGGGGAEFGGGEDMGNIGNPGDADINFDDWL